MKLLEFAPHLLAITMVVVIFASEGIAQNSSQECQAVEVDSAGTIGFRPSKIEGIEGVEVWREVGRPVPYLVIRPPASNHALWSDDIQEINLTADIGPPLLRAVCRKTNYSIDRGERITCWRSVSGYPLAFSVKYRMPATPILDGKYEDRTDALAGYISSDVLCTKKVDPQRA